MPTYTFINQATGDIEGHFMISELDDFVKTSPQLERVLTAPAIVGSVSIKDKEPQEFKDVMSRIAENNPGSNLDKYKRKSINEVKNKQQF